MDTNSHEFQGGDRPHGEENPTYWVSASRVHERSHFIRVDSSPFVVEPIGKELS